MARAADRMTIEERIERIADIFATFRNPDKETVLTPWRVVNMHLGDTLGGYCFYDKEYKEPLQEPRYIDRGRVTDEVFASDSYLLEINSKSGLYPLYLAYNLYRRAAKEQMFSPETLEEHQAVWDKEVRENIFVICKTPMAQRITRRTLMGFRDGKVNAMHTDNLIEQIKNNPDGFIKMAVQGKTYWKSNNNDNMKFKAVVGNPPYQVMDGGGTGSSAVPVYNLFVDVAKRMNPNIASMIMPAKWYSGGRGLDQFREDMLNDKRISLLADYPDSRDVFPTVDIAGGVCYFSWNKDYSGDCKIITTKDGKRTVSMRSLSDYDSFIRDNVANEIINKVNVTECCSLCQMVGSRRPFGIRSNDYGSLTFFDNSISCFTNKGIRYFERSAITNNEDAIDKYKVIISKTSAEHAGQTDKEGRRRIIMRLEVLPPGMVCSESYLLVDYFEDKQHAINLQTYLKTRFVRFMMSTILLTQNIVASKFRFVPLQDFTSSSDIDWSASVEDIDRQLYAKYGLSEEEIRFVEEKIKGM